MMSRDNAASHYIRGLTLSKLCSEFRAQFYYMMRVIRFYLMLLVLNVREVIS